MPLTENGGPAGGEPHTPFSHVFSGICGNGPTGKEPNLFVGPGGGKNARKIPLLLPIGGPSRKQLLRPGQGVGLILLRVGEG
jgi:hypothetical protein